MTALTAVPAVIDGQRLGDAASITRRYALLLETGRTAAVRPLATKPSAPVMARVRDVGDKLPTAAKDLGLTADDHAVGVTVEGSGLRFVLFIRQGPSPNISGVAR